MATKRKTRKKTSVRKSIKTPARLKKSRKEKYVYFFSRGKGEGKSKMKQLLGGKGANLAEMTNLGIPVPPGFTVATNVCALYYKNNKRYPSFVQTEIDHNLSKLEKASGKKFGDPKNPLLISVRSGAAVSLPGMMDTVLNLGLNQEVVEGLSQKMNNPRFAWDSYRRFIQMFANVVLDINPHNFEEILQNIKQLKGVVNDTDLDVEALKLVVKDYKSLVLKETGKDFPDQPKDQLAKSINAVFSSWNNDRAVYYRKMHDIKGLIGTAVNVQAMVYGNMNDNSATGVCFSRNPATGANKFYGEFLINAQGEDVVAGVRTPQEISLEGSKEWAKNNNIDESDRKKNFPSLEEVMPKVYKQLVQIKNRLEKHYREMQDMEFTIEEGILYFLQTRTGKRTAASAVNIAVDMVKEKLITKTEAVLRIEPSQLDQLLHPTFDPGQEKKVIAKGLNASPGAAVGKVVFSADEAVSQSADHDVILVRIETSPEDIQGMDKAKGILTARGGATSHAAVVARGMGKCCVAGCSAITIDYKNGYFITKDGVKVNQGDDISLDGSTGEVMLGSIQTVEPSLSGKFSQLMKWADQMRKLKVRTNADTPHDTEVARKFGAEGIGLCRTEHMFFEGDRIIAMREMILAETKEKRILALNKLLPMQRDDFKGIFKAMQGFPVTIRLLDPPLHEFVPHDDKGQQAVAEALGIPVSKVNMIVNSLHEFNPMLGHRGCRLGITYPEIYDMQVRAIMEAACEMKKQKIRIFPEIMIPLIGD
ncbi:pyruvate, phosphate dikinase, partial [PVC group bacterium]|nr:pyruvate, phosphate dikinase [PVC group bacterium]